MKNILLAALMLLPPTLQAQHHQFVITDTAAHVVDNYLRLLNLDDLPEDSILFLETSITHPGNTDTFTMRRWYARPQMFRVEVWRDDTLQTGLCSNGVARFRHYNPNHGHWDDLRAERFHNELIPYDFRGPLYNWRHSGAELTWKGTVDYNGHPLQAVHVAMPDRYERTYLFDPSNGLLTLILETDSLPSGARRHPEARIEWKIVHEYLPVSTSLLPSLESFLRGTTLTILATKPQLLPRDILIFNRDDL